MNYHKVRLDQAIDLAVTFATTIAEEATERAARIADRFAEAARENAAIGYRLAASRAEQDQAVRIATAIRSTHQEKGAGQ